MGDCILIYNEYGEVNGVQTLSGDVSKLYPQLLERTKDVEKAVELTAYTRTDTFQEGVIFPILSKYKVAVKRQLETLQTKNSVLQIVHNGKEHTVDIKKLQYKLVEANGFTTLQAYAQVGDESVMLGKVRMKAYKDGLAIESTNLGTTQVYVDGTLESLQGKGIGTEMYKYAINHTLRQGKPFYSDASQTASATGVWEKLKTTKVVKKDGDRNKIEAFPSTHFDNNHEVLPEVLIKYIKAEQTKDKQLSFDQKQDIKNALLSSPFANSQEMNEALQKAFYNKKGEFQVEEKKLKSFYNSYEIASIITDKVLQKEIKSTLEALKNSEEVFVNNTYFLGEFLNKVTTLSSLGKMVNTNPLATEQEVIQELGGIADEQEFADKIEDLEMNLKMGDTTEVVPTISTSLSSKYKQLSKKVKQGNPEQYWSFDLPSNSAIEEAAANGKLVDVPGGMSIVSNDGDIKGVFKYDLAIKETASEVLAESVAKGGVKLDNFDGYLTNIYEKAGFRIVSRVPFSEEYTPQGWNKKSHGTPDVVAMVYDPSSRLSIEEKTFDDYDAAIAYRDSYIGKAVEGNALFNDSLKEASTIAEAYMKENGIEIKPIEKILKLDETQSKRISDAYIAMEVTPTDPKTIAAYSALVEETLKQYNFIIKSGYKLEVNNNEPYSSTKEMIGDLRTNKRMKILSTESGFGEEPITDKQREENMLLKDSGFKDVNGETLLVNDIFRFVHDFFGHAKLGNGFGAIGEENAWNVHIKMYSPLAARAMTTETRGQNSYVNFSGVNDEAFKIRDKVRELRKEGRNEEAVKLTEKVYDMMEFAEQKVGLLPEWVSSGAAPISGGAAFSKFFAKITNTKDGGAKFADVKEVLNKEIDGYENELAAYLKYGMNFQKHIMASIPAFVDARIRVLKGMVEASKILGKGGKEVNMLDITSSEGYFTKAYAQLAQDKGVNAKADALDAGVTFQRDFNEAPQVPGVNYLLQAWGDSFVDPDSGITIPSFKPTKKYGVVFEGMGFQFFTPTRDKEIAEVKGMMEENGMLVTMQKFKNSDYEKREVLKDEFKAKFFTKEEMAQKAATVLKKSDEVSVGMMDYQFDRQEYEKVLAKNFKYVAQFYSAGNFAGYLATDSLEIMNTALNATGDTTTKFNEEVTPKIIQGEEIEYKPEAQLSEKGTVDPKYVVVSKSDSTNPSFEDMVDFNIEGGTLEIGKINGKETYSILHLKVDESKRRQGLATKLLQKALDETKGELSGMASNDMSVGLNYNLGMRAFDAAGKELSLEEAKKTRAAKAGESIRMILPENERGDNYKKTDTKLLSKTKEVAQATEAKVIPAKTTGRRGIDGDNEEANLKQTTPKIPTPVSKTINKSLFQKMQDFKRMPEMKIVGEGLQQVENNDIKVQLEQTFALAEDQSISSDIIYLNELSQDLYDENIQDVQELIQEIEKKAAKQGIDIVGLGEKISSKTRDDIYDLLESLNTLTTAPSQEAFEDFIVQHELIFGTEKTPSIKVQKVLPSNKNKSLISLDTKVSEYVLFDKLGLVKVSEGVYQRVQKEELSDLYNKLYEISQYNEGILPVEAFPFLNKGGVLNLETLRNAENRDIIIEDIKEFIENKVTTLDLPSTSTDNTVLQQLLINKYAFNHPIVVNSEVDVQQEFEDFNNFDGSEAYLTTDFISDFYQEYLAEKIKDSKLFKDFYSNFTVNEKGIVLVKDDAITVGVIKDYLKERKVKKAKDLANYSLLSNHLPNLKVATEQSSDYSREFFRNLYTNNPMSLEKLRQDYSVLGANTILIKNSTENFVRVKGGVMELMTTKGGVSFYEKIGENKGEYKTFKSEEPILSVDSSQYGTEEVSSEDFIKAEKYYTKKQEGEIDDEYLACL